VIGNTEVVEYIYNWFAHVLQFPSRKTEVCLLLFGNQGCGKSSIAEYLMREILGADKMLITSKVDKAFGRFVNTQGKLLAVLNEANGKETFNISDILKDAITCGQTEQEKKGIDAVSVIDYTNYIFTTNNLNSVKIPKDDRRFMPITLNDTYLKNAPFFDKLYSLFNDKEVMRTFYDELMSRDIKLFNPSRDRIETEIMIDMKSMNMDPVEQFIDYWRNNLEFHMERKMRSSDLYLKFRHFWEEDGRKSMDIPTSIKFSVRLKQFSNYIRHYKQSNWYFELLE
jgi:GTPase SAR1 family protein